MGPLHLFLLRHLQVNPFLRFLPADVVALHESAKLCGGLNMYQHAAVNQTVEAGLKKQGTLHEEYAPYRQMRQLLQIYGLPDGRKLQFSMFPSVLAPPTAHVLRPFAECGSHTGVNDGINPRCVVLTPAKPCSKHRLDQPAPGIIHL